jgi:hypothetical protein
LNIYESSQPFSGVACIQNIAKHLGADHINLSNSFRGAISFYVAFLIDQEQAGHSLNRHVSHKLGNNPQPQMTHE